MRGQFQDQSELFSYIDVEERIPKKHPLRQVRALVREVLSNWIRSFNVSIRMKAARRSRPRCC